jgi:hypothetical protein
MQNRDCMHVAWFLSRLSPILIPRSLNFGKDLPLSEFFGRLGQASLSDLGMVTWAPSVKFACHLIHGSGRWGRVSGVYYPRVGLKGPALVRFLVIKKEKGSRIYGGHELEGGGHSRGYGPHKLL